MRMYTWLWWETRQCVCYKDLLEDILKGQYCIKNMLLKVWNRQGKPMLESIAYISYTVACCVKSFEKHIYLILLFAGEQFVIESDGLLVRNVRRTDAGTYTCRARFVNSYKYLKRIHKKDQFNV